MASSSTERLEKRSVEQSSDISKPRFLAQTCMKNLKKMFIGICSYMIAKVYVVKIEIW